MVVSVMTEGLEVSVMVGATEVLAAGPDSVMVII